MAAKKATTNAVATWDEELARQAQMAAKMEESTAIGQFFSLKSGVLTLNDAPLPNNEMAVVILDSILETVYYESKYDPDDPQGPTAFAFGRDEKTLVWHENSAPEFAGKLCSESEVCQWGSAEVGRGKAARETRRLAMIPAGTFENNKFKAFTDEEQFESTMITYLRLPVTSVKGYAAFVKQVVGALKRPPYAIFTRVKVIPDPKFQFRVVFEPLSQVPDELLDTIMRRHEEAKASIEFPYAPNDSETVKLAPRNRGTKAASATRGKRY